jgi:hypothetical protein
MVRNIKKTLENWSKKYNERFGLSSSSWSGATVRETSAYTDRAHIVIGMTSKHKSLDEWDKDKEQILQFFPRIFEIDFYTQKANIFLDERSDI